MPRSGDVLHVGKAASVQFWRSPILFRVIGATVHGSTPDGWVWLDGYELDERGTAAIERRSIFVQLAGLRLAQAAAPATPAPARKPANTRPVVPRPRPGAHDSLPAARKR